jgi:hypothetical protein
MEFYKLDVPSFTQYKYAWAEPAGKPKISDDCERCPKCNRPVSLLFYVPPFNIEIKQPRRIGDFVGGIIPFDLVVSERFMKEYWERSIINWKNKTWIYKERPKTTLDCFKSEKQKLDCRNNFQG